jgi:hypothetical protein
LGMMVFLVFGLALAGCGDDDAKSTTTVQCSPQGGGSDGYKLTIVNNSSHAVTVYGNATLTIPPGSSIDTESGSASFSLTYSPADKVTHQLQTTAGRIVFVNK